MSEFVFLCVCAILSLVGKGLEMGYWDLFLTFELPPAVQGAKSVNYPQAGLGAKLICTQTQYTIRN